MTVHVGPRSGSRCDVHEIVLDRPARANALDSATVELLHEALDTTEKAGPRLVVLRARGRHFCAGVDLSELAAETDATLLHRLCRIALLLERLYTAAFVTVARVDGIAVGAGADLVAACDHRIAVPPAALRFPGPQFGAVLGTRRLAGLVGHGQATSLVAGRRSVDAAAARQLGLLTQLHDAAPDADRAVDELADSVAGLPGPELAQLLAAARPPADGELLADLVRSLVGRPGLRHRMAAHAESRVAG